MGRKVLGFMLLLITALFISYRFGLFREKKDTPTQIRQVNDQPTDIPKPFTKSPTNILSFRDEQASPPAKIRILSATGSAQRNSVVIVTWIIDETVRQDISSTTIRFGPVSKPNPKLSSDYPDKTAILKGYVPATFSAQLLFDFPGTYYYRAHAIVGNKNIWSDEKQVTVLEATTSATLQ